MAGKRENEGCLGRNVLLLIKSTEYVSVFQSSAQKRLRTDMSHFKFCPGVPLGVLTGSVELTGRSGSGDMTVIPAMGRPSKASL